MGKYSDEKRVERDFYPTPIKAAYPVASYIKGMNFACPFAGDGRLIEHLRKLQPSASCVWASDIEPQVKQVLGTPVHQVDFNEVDASFWEEVAEKHKVDIWLDNPPWLNSKESGYQLQRSIHTLAKIRPVWFLMNGNFVFNKKSAPTMKICSDVVPVGRVKWIEESAHSGKEDVAWFRFDATGSETQLTYMHPREH